MHQELHINGDFWLVVRIDLILLVLESVLKFHKISSRLVSIKESQNNLLSTFSGVIWGHNKVDFTRTTAGNVKITDIITSNDPHNVGNFDIAGRILGKIDLKITSNDLDLIHHVICRMQWTCNLVPFNNIHFR